MDLVSNKLQGQLSGLLEDSTDMITRANLDGRLTYVSPASKYILGFEPSELLGRNAFEFHHPEDLKILEAGIKRLMEGAEVDSIIYRSIKKDGTYVWLESTGRLIRDKMGNVLEIQGSSRDITERLRYQLELEKRFRNLEDEVSKRKLIEEDLIHEKGFKDSIIKHSSLGISALDPTLRIKEWNPALEKMTGRKREDVIGRSWTDLYPELIGNDLHLQFLRVLDGETIELKERKFISGRGYHNSILSPLKGENGQIIGLLSITDDITAEYQLRKEIGKNEKFLKSITDTSPNIISVVDLEENKLLYANKEFFQLFTYSEEEAYSMPVSKLIQQLVHKEDRELVASWYLQLAQLETEFSETEFKVIDSSNNVRWYNCRAVNFKKGGNGKALQVLINSKDVTSRKEAELELKKSRDLLKEAQRSARLGIWEWDISTDKITWSEELYNIYGLKEGEQELSFSTFVHLIHPDDRDIVVHIVTESLKNHESFTFEHRLVQPGGVVRYLLANGKVLLNKDGQPAQMIGTALDVSDLRGTEALLRKKEEFMSIASHELKTPLTSAKAYMDLLKRELSKSGNSTLIGYAERTAMFIEKLNGLISDLLDVSKIQAGKIIYQFTPFDLDQMIAECCETFQATVPRHKIVISGACGVAVNGDRERLSQVVSNLLSNASKYSPDSNRIEVSVRKKGQSVFVSVKDYGMGISPPNLTKIFDRFFRVEDSRTFSQGLGIGLYLCKEIVHRHNGKIYAESEEGAWSEFTFELPLGR